MSKGRRAFGILYIAVMAALIAGGFMLPNENNQNRVLSSLSDIKIESVKTITELPSKIDEVLIDNFPMKSQMVKLSTFFSYKYFDSVFSEKVLLGKDGWIFYTIPGENPVEKYTGKELFTQDQLEGILDRVRMVKQICEKKNAELIIMIAPSKMTIYPEKLPDGIEKVSDITKTDQFYSIIEDNLDVTLVDVRRKLMDGKSEHQLYWATDTHWNQYGAYIAYEELMNALETDRYIKLQDWEMEKVRYAGDISKNILGLGSMITEETDVYTNPGPGYFFLDDNYKDDGMNITENHDKSFPSLLFVHDSFGDAMLPMIDESFYRVCDVVPSMAIPLDYPAIGKFEADYLFIEITERAINNINALFEAVIESEAAADD